MKVKLLKLLRNKFRIEYFPSTKQYKINRDSNPKYFDSLESAKAQQECDIINYGRKHYEKYSKRIIIK